MFGQQLVELVKIGVELMQLDIIGTYLVGQLRKIRLRAKSPNLGYRVRRGRGIIGLFQSSISVILEFDNLFQGI